MVDDLPTGTIDAGGAEIPPRTGNGPHGRRYGKSAAQVALRWQLQQPFVATIPKAASREPFTANAEVFDFELTAGEMGAVFELGGGLSAALADRVGV